MRRTLIGVLCVAALGTGLAGLGTLTHAAGPSSVVDAAMSGNRDVVRTLLQGGADVNTALADGIATMGDPAVRRASEEAEREVESLDAGGDCRSMTNPTEQIEARRSTGADCRLTKAAARSFYAEMAVRLRVIGEAERAGVEAMTAIAGSGSAPPSRGGSQGRTR